MLYNILKILHILSATFLLSSGIYCGRLWLKSHNSDDYEKIIDKIQLQTWSIIIPVAIFQLATGFTMISLKQYALSELWITISISGFILLIIGWFSFLYTLLSPEIALEIRKKRLSLLIGISTITVLIMIFFMANKIA